MKKHKITIILLLLLQIAFMSTILQAMEDQHLATKKTLGVAPRAEQPPITQLPYFSLDKTISLLPQTFSQKRGILDPVEHLTATTLLGLDKQDNTITNLSTYIEHLKKYLPHTQEQLEIIYKNASEADKRLRKARDSLNIDMQSSIHAPIAKRELNALNLLVLRNRSFQLCAYCLEIESSLLLTARNTLYNLLLQLWKIELPEYDQKILQTLQKDVNTAINTFADTIESRVITNSKVSRFKHIKTTPHLFWKSNKST